MTRYLLTGNAWPGDHEADELNYDGNILGVDICGFTKPWADVTTPELETVYALPEPACDVVNCESCQVGYFDECSSCDCKGPDGHGRGNHSICTTNTCPPGTQTTAPVCRCFSDTKVFPDTGVIIRRVGSNFCKFATCPPPRQPTGCCPAEPYWGCLEYSQCPDGSFVYRDPSRLCEFPQCNPAPCTGELTKTCLDGTVVSRNPGFGCTFDECPAPTCKVCPFGFFDGCDTCSCREGHGCTTRDCSEYEEPTCFSSPPDDLPVVCVWTDRKACPDGVFVGRVMPVWLYRRLQRLSMRCRRERNLYRSGMSGARRCVMYS